MWKKDLRCIFLSRVVSSFTSSDAVVVVGISSLILFTYIYIYMYVCAVCECLVFAINSKCLSLNALHPLFSHIFYCNASTATTTTWISSSATSSNWKQILYCALTMLKLVAVNCSFENDSKMYESYSPTHTNHCEIAVFSFTHFVSKTKAVSIYVNVLTTRSTMVTIPIWVYEWWTCKTSGTYMHTNTLKDTIQSRSSAFMLSVFSMIWTILWKGFAMFIISILLRIYVFVCCGNSNVLAFLVLRTNDSILCINHANIFCPHIWFHLKSI